MRNLSLIILVLLIFSQDIFSQNIIWNETPEQRTERMKWWTDARFGMFIHWGIYALPARHEWVKQRERITDENYRKYFEEFNPDLYDPSEWAALAKEAGMKYVVLTAKHHDGFCLFESKYTDYHAGNTPYGKDLIKEYVDAFREAGMGVGFYYSLIDWHHPHFPIDRVHPQRTTSKEEYDRLNKGRDMAVYRE
jgi:alpha-L-fucosidase